MPRLATFIAIAATLLAGAPARANRPLVSDTADVIASGACQIESPLLRESGSGLSIARAWDTLFSCGVPHDTQLGVGYTRANSEGQTAQHHLLAGKTSLVQPESGRTGWGIGYGVAAVKLPGLSVRVENISVIGLVTRELASGVLVHANLGWNHNQSDRLNTTLWSLGVETTSDFTVAADVFGDDRSRPWVSAGMGYLFGGGFSANLSYALQFENPRVKSLSVGINLAF